MAPSPLLLRLRSGKTAARVIAFGFGGGTMLLGAASLAGAAMKGANILPGLLGYALGASPLFLLALIVGLCKNELWFDPDARAFRLLTYRPWRLGPRVEEAPLSDYAGVRTEAAGDGEGGGVIVSLVATSGEIVPMRQFDDGADADARKFADDLGALSGLWVRHGGPPPGEPHAAKS